MNTFAGYSASRVNPQWVQMVQQQVAAFIDRLLNAGLAETEGDLIHLTLLGRACGSSSLSFESSLRLVELVRTFKTSEAAPIHVLAIVQVLAEMDAVYTPIMRKGQSEAARTRDVSSRYGHSITSILQRYCADRFEFWARCKRAALVYDWIEGIPIDALEKRYSTTPFAGAIGYGNIIGIADATRFHLRSAHQILATLLPDQQEFLKELDEVLQRLEFGLPFAALPLAKLRVALTRGQCLALFGAGVTTSDHIRGMDDESLRQCVGRPTAGLLRTALVRERTAEPRSE